MKSRTELASSIRAILERVGSRVTPTSQERATMDRLSDRLRREVERILVAHGFQADVTIQGSVAKDTWLHGEADLDIFTRFPSDMDRQQWTGRVLPALRKSLRRYPIIERYAEHPYLEFHVEKVRVNVVPCYAVEKGNWKSATDRTPFHTDYMRAHLTPELRREVRILKKFLKGIGAYGAEVRIGGFSGMLVETLTLNYGSFLLTLEGAGRWKNPAFVELEPSGRKQSDLVRKFESSLMVVDPVDPNRNLAAAVREERLWEFVAAGRGFLENPVLSYFYPLPPRPRTKAQLLARLNSKGYDIIAIQFPHAHMVLDVLWGQLFSLERAIVNLSMRYEFRVLHSGVWSDEEHSSAILLAVENSSLPLSQLHQGPPVSRIEESGTFLARHVDAPDTVGGPRIKADRWMVEKKRMFPRLTTLLAGAGKEKKLELSIPSGLEPGFRKHARVLENVKALSFYSLPGFARALWDFMDGRPSWLKKSPD